MRKKPTKKTLKRNCKEQFNAWVRGSGVCVAKGERGIECSNRLECCHLKSCGIEILRFDQRNVVPMCNLHHRHYTEHADHWTEFIDRLLPGLWNELDDLLVEHRDKLGKTDYRALYEELLKQLREGEYDSWLDWHEAVRA